MIEENNDIFLAGHPLSTHVSYDTFFNFPHLYALLRTCTHFGLPPTPFIPLAAYVLNGWPISQPKNK